MFSKEDDKSLRISQIHHKRKEDLNSEIKMFGKMLGIILAILIIGPGIIAISSGMPEGAISEDIPFQDEVYYQGENAVYLNQQLVLLDVTYDHAPTNLTARYKQAFSFFSLPSGMPSNLVTPINYAQGTLYQRLQVIDKPSSKTVKYQTCLFQDSIIPSKHACSNENKLTFSNPGTYFASQSMTTLFQYSNIQWSRSLLKQMLVIKDGSGIPVDISYTGWDGRPNFALYYPMKVRYTSIIVPPGGGSPIWPSDPPSGNGVTVISPNGGESWQRGTAKTISWSSTGSTGANVKIELLKNGVLNSVITSSTPNDGSYPWTIPSTQVLGNDYKIKITSTSNSAYTDASNSNFQINNGISGINNITVLSPNGGENWLRGSQQTIRWTSTGIPSTENVDIKIFQGTIQRAHWITPNDGIFYLTVTPITYPIGTNYNVKITGIGSYSAISDVSSSYFRVS